jgi:hypothetical protein
MLRRPAAWFLMDRDLPCFRSRPYNRSVDTHDATSDASARCLPEVRVALIAG